MLINIHSTNATEMPCHIAEQCHEMCKPGSEMQGLFHRVAMLSLEDIDYLAVVAYAYLNDPDDGATVVGWCVISTWQVGEEQRVQAQGFVRPDYRRRGLAGAMAACLTHDFPHEEVQIAVFSPEFLSIAKRLGWQATQYRLVEDGWIGVGTADGRDIGTGTDEK